MTRPVDVNRVRQLFNYDQDTGLLTWKVKKSNRALVGTVVSSINNEGYVQVGVDGARRLAHHVIWAWWYGESPTDDIDHINRDRSDNRIANLRMVPRTENLLNARHFNATGYTGVMQVPNGRFRSAIHVKRKCTYIGTFDTAEEAHAAYAKQHVELYGEKSKFHPKHVNPQTPI